MKVALLSMAVLVASPIAFAEAPGIGDPLIGFKLDATGAGVFHSTLPPGQNPLFLALQPRGGDPGIQYKYSNGAAMTKEECDRVLKAERADVSKEPAKGCLTRYAERYSGKPSGDRVPDPQPYHVPHK